METFSNTDLLEPVELYKTRLKDAFHDNAIKYFEELEKKANVNVDLNQEACSRYYKEAKTVNDLNSKKNKKRAGKIAAIFFGAVGIVAGIVIFILLNSTFKNSKTLGIVIGILAILLGIGLIVLAIVVSKKIKDIEKEIAAHQEKADAALAEAYASMTSLNDLLEWNMTANLMSETTPLIQLDQIFDARKYEMLHDRFGYNENNRTDESIVYVQSGSILGNPFVFEKNYCQTMVNYMYTGTRMVTYSVQERDSNGRLVTRSVTETLHASLQEPKPDYYFDTTLIYGNDAAPNLSFSRSPTKINSMNEKQIEKYVKNFDKDLDKKAEKAIKKGESFTRLANEEFEALFNALNRDNETEFRLLFTPLGQINMVKLLKEKEVGFGDDFIFKKEKKLNYVNCAHMQGTDSLDRSPDSLKCFDYKVAKDTFVNYADKYLKDIFFNFAPLISIPVYQQHKTIEYIYKGTFKQNITKAEVESAANGHNVDLFKHPQTRSDGVILKSKFIRSEGKADVCDIVAHSFRGEDRVTNVPVRAGNGHYYDVPVNWVEYFPISKTTPFVVTDTNANTQEFRTLRNEGKFDDIINKFSSSHDMLYKKRIFSFLMKDK